MFGPINNAPDPSPTIEVELNGKRIKVKKGVSVASITLCQGERHTRTTTVSGSKRAPFCMMGVCYDCIMIINGKANQRACAIEAEDGMTIETQLGVGSAIEGHHR